MTAASPSDILRAVERWARVRGFVQANHGRAAWCVDPYLGELDVWDNALAEGNYVSPAIALAWALLVESDAAPVDVGRCSACVARGGPEEWQQAISGFDDVQRWEGYWSRDAPSWTCSLLSDRVRRPSDFLLGPGKYRLVASRPCPACNGTGRETIPAARLLLDAVSGDARARDALDVHAEAKLRDRGNPLGELLGWALILWTGEPTADCECPDCEGRGYQCPPFPSGVIDCGDCSGSGRIPGHPHTAEAVRWLEWLTWAREFEAERNPLALATDRHRT